MSDIEIISGLVVLMALVASRRVDFGPGWSWPIPDLEVGGGLQPATISQEFRTGGGNPHFGVDLMYASRSPPPLYTAPPGVPVVAARSGRLWSASRTARGWAVVVDHGAPWATFYQHLDSLSPEVAAAAESGDVGQARRGGGLQLAAAQRLGVMGSDPTDGGHVRHLHFAVWYRGHGDASSVDPAKAMQTWRRSRWKLTQ